MNWRTFWQTVDRFGEQSAPRCEWRRALGGDFERFEPLLQAGRALADSIHDPDDLTQAMDIFDNGGGVFEAHSTEIPPHRKPLLLARSELVLLTVNAPKIGRALADEMRLVPGQFRSRSLPGLHEMGIFLVPGGMPLPVFLLVPDGRSRVLQITESMFKLKDAILLVPSSRGAADGNVCTLATERGVTLRSLEIQPDRVLASIKNIHNSTSKGIKPVFEPRAGWTWEMLALNFSHERFVATIDSQKFEGRWDRHGIATMNSKGASGFLEVLLRLARKEPMRQGRNDVATRQQVSRFRTTVRKLFPLEGEPLAFKRRQLVPSFRVMTGRV